MMALKSIITLLLLSVGGVAGMGFDQLMNCSIAMHPEAPRIQKSCDNKIEQFQRDLGNWDFASVSASMHELAEQSRQVAGVCQSSDASATLSGASSLGCVPSVHAAMRDYARGLMKSTSQGSETCSRDSMMGQAATSMVGLLEVFTSFWCLENHEGVPCTLAILHAMDDAGLDDIMKQVISSGGNMDAAPLMKNQDPAKWCRAMDKAGCCVRSFIQFLEVVMDLTCQSNAMPGASDMLQMMPNTCAIPTMVGGPGVVLPDACPGFNPDEYKEYKVDKCPSDMDFVDDAQEENYCAEFEGKCPANICELGCALAEEAAGDDDDDFWQEEVEWHKKGGKVDRDWKARQDRIAEKRAQKAKNIDIRAWEDEADEMYEDFQPYDWPGSNAGEEPHRDVPKYRPPKPARIEKDGGRGGVPTPTDDDYYSDQDVDSDFWYQPDHNAVPVEAGGNSDSGGELKANIWISAIVGVGVSVSIAAVVFIVWQARQRSSQNLGMAESMRFQPLDDISNGGV